MILVLGWDDYLNLEIWAKYEISTCNCAWDYYYSTPNIFLPINFYYYSCSIPTTFKFFYLIRKRVYTFD